MVGRAISQGFDCRRVVAFDNVNHQQLGTFNAGQPQGAAVVLRVVSAPLGIISTVEVVNIVPDSDPAFGGSYFYTYSQAGGN